ncbi:hypothetical protein [Paenibacillus agilis]|uniref:DUF4025 domain-containing protein n=1 Tax=Paenibacillus agilis TaxID=3020863 RepID=A0A559J0Y3_9BACL|nr:hypothetical protein [Paenibacillus agilis]TVX93544.1 hypothetical protein FPZ44_11065 [Paenibacillus agilis]
MTQTHSSNQVSKAEVQSTKLNKFPGVNIEETQSEFASELSAQGTAQGISQGAQGASAHIAPATADED